MFDTLVSLLNPHTVGDALNVPQTVMILFLVIWSWVLLGRINIRGFALGISAVMFSGILFGHLGYHINHEISDFLKDFGLMLFVYAIGISVGPYFFSSFKKEGLKFNLFALGTVLGGWLFAMFLAWVSGITIDNMVGIMSGAVTNTPGLGAAKSVLTDITHITKQNFQDPANGYALTYPFGVMGVILLMIFAKKIFRIDIKKEEERFLEEAEKNNPSPVRMTCRVIHEEMFGKTIGEIIHLLGHNRIHISRLKRSGTTEVIIPDQDTVLQRRDVLTIVGNTTDVTYTVNTLGRISTDTVIDQDPGTHHARFLISKESIAFHSLAELRIQDLYNVHVTRIIRGDIEFIATPHTVLQIGDRIQVVGHNADLKTFEHYVGNREKSLYEPNMIALSIGAIFGALLGAIPLSIGGLAYPIKLGMAAGPLIVALLISRYSVKFHVSPYLHKSTLHFIKDFGIMLFFAVVGLKAWGTFWDTFIKYHGLIWIGYGLLITIIPLLFMVMIGYHVLKINFLQLIGLMAASYTDPAALAFGAKYFGSDIPNQSYATVYPLVTIARIIVAQVLILLMI